MGIEVHTPRSLRDEEEQKKFQALKLDVAMVVAYGLILPQAYPRCARLGCLNIHASLLPRWRGAAPIQRAILAGDAETGVSIMQMDAGLDTGPVLIEKKMPIAANATAPRLLSDLGPLGARVIVQALAGRADGSLKPVAQSTEGASYAARLMRDDGLIDWKKSATEIERQVRAL